MLGKTENWRVWIFRLLLRGGLFLDLIKKMGIGSPSQSTFTFFYLGACKELGKTENRQVWIDFPYPKEIFLALHFDRYCSEIKKGNTCFSD